MTMTGRNITPTEKTRIIPPPTTLMVITIVENDICDEAGGGTGLGEVDGVGVELGVLPGEVVVLSAVLITLLLLGEGVMDCVLDVAEVGGTGRGPEVT